MHNVVTDQGYNEGSVYDAQSPTADDVITGQGYGIGSVYMTLRT